MINLVFTINSYIVSLLQFLISSVINNKYDIVNMKTSLKNVQYYYDVMVGIFLKKVIET